MTNLAKFVVTTDGWDGAPGINVLMFSAGTLLDLNDVAVQSAYDEIHTLFSDLKTYLAPGLTVNVSTEAGIIDAATGDLVNIIPVATSGGPITSTGSSGEVTRAAQLNVRHTTDVFLRGRRLKGRSFIGPIAAGLFDSQGNIASASAAFVTNKFVAMTSGVGVRLAVWQRPSTANGGVGTFGDVVLSECQATPGILRSRRD
jgi:hypothetical protein